ncbi:MAG: LysM peptidoglycan-binding domain-containing protein [Anaerolineales bacterium]|nr:MAG: LysM peptidoglycan-binding domain-containing protein [Anaerolineales bacterium]
MRNIFFSLLILLLASLACNFPTTTLGPGQGVSVQGAVPTAAVAQATPQGAAAPAPTLPPTRDPNTPILTPTPDAPHAQLALRTDSSIYTVQPGDSLNAIAERLGVTLQQLLAANNIPNPNALNVGQVINVPPQQLTNMGPNFKIIPDSELVNGPYAIAFNVQDFINNQPGYLRQHQEQVDQQFLSGAAILQRVATEYSVNPKLLLALLEYYSGWLTNPNPASSTLTYPMGKQDSWRTGLYSQLSWAADNLNKGFYDWRAGLAAAWNTTDGIAIPPNPTINAGTAGVQRLLGLMLSESQWRSAVSEQGFVQTYTRLFGYPFDYAIEPLAPAGISQPALQLPFEPRVPWVFSGGPHGGWGNGSAWASLDFAPGAELYGCNPSPEWVVAAADGLVVRADNGAVVQDLDGDGYEQTGWTVLYMHVAASQRVQAGAYLRAGERIGHASCEGGVATATHLHIARRYNGVWIPAAGDLPFVMDGWVSVSNGILYDGSLVRDGVRVDACECRFPANMVQRQP